MKITQNKLDNYSNTLKKTNGSINLILGINTNNIKNWYNDYWISNTAKNNAYEIDSILDNYQEKIINLFNEINNKIKRNVIIHNNKYSEEKVYYNKKQLYKTKSNITSRMNNSLAKGYIGRLHNTADVYYPIKKAADTIEELDKKLQKAINSCEVITNKGEYRTNLQQIKKESLNQVDIEINKLKSIYEK